MAEHVQYFADEKSRRLFLARQIILKVLIYLFLTVFALFLIAPFVLMIVGSFVNSENFYQFSKNANFGELGFQNWGFSNYKEVFSDTYKDNFGQIHKKSGNNFSLFFLNTFIVAIGSTTVTVVTAVLAAFAFARLEFKGKDVLFALLLSTMMIPGEMMVITNFMVVKFVLFWENTFAALILVHGVSVFYVFYLRQTFQQIPNELYLAAKVDGVGDLGYLWKVMIPIAMPTITTIIILSMMGSWNSYVWPELVARGTWMDKGKHEMLLVSNGLRRLFALEGGVQDAVKIAGSMVISIPLFLVFILFRKYIMRGVSRSGIKG